MLKDGLYEQIINKSLDAELATTDKLSTTAPIDSAEASKVLAKYIAEVVEQGLDNVIDNGGNIMVVGDVHVSRVNGIVGFVEGGIYTFGELGILHNYDGITEVNGKLVILGLEAGDYYLKETVAPDGYNLLTDPVKVTIVADEFDKDGVVTKQNSVDFEAGGTTYQVNNDAEYEIENFAGVELPSTGGEGTMMMITIGTMVAMAFAVLMITQKKMSIYQD